MVQRVGLPVAGSDQGGPARAVSALEQCTLARAAGPDLAAVVEVLVGSLYYRWLLTGRAIDERAVDGLIGMFMDAYGESGV